MSASNEDLAYISYLIYNKTAEPIKIKKGGLFVAPSGMTYTVLDYIEDPSGYAGAILKDSFGNIVLAHRGTEFGFSEAAVLDLVATDVIMMGVLQINNQIPAAEVLLLEAQAFAADSGGELVMTGHSLGGSITQILAAKHQAEQIRGVTFNAFGAVGIDDTPTGGEALVTNYMRAMDMVANLGTHYGSVVKHATEAGIGGSSNASTIGRAKCSDSKRPSMSLPMDDSPLLRIRVELALPSPLRQHTKEAMRER